MKKIKILPSLLTVCLIFAPSFVSYASVTSDETGDSIENVTYSEVEKSGENATNVYALLHSEYNITIPKTVVLNGDTKEANYIVKAEGDIAGYEILNIVPSSSFKLYSKNKSAVDASISQDITSWTYDTLGTDGNGKISAPKLSAGNWNGNFDFNIELTRNRKNLSYEECYDILTSMATEGKTYFLFYRDAGTHDAYYGNVTARISKSLAWNNSMTRFVDASYTGSLLTINGKTNTAIANKDGYLAIAKSGYDINIFSNMINSTGNTWEIVYIKKGETIKLNTPLSTWVTEFY